MGAKTPGGGDCLGDEAAQQLAPYERFDFRTRTVPVFTIAPKRVRI
jgi:hypothetical protein